jgi:hypothetical protein
MSIFVTPGEMSQQIFHGLDPEAAQRKQTRPRDPIQLCKRLGGFH